MRHVLVVVVLAVLVNSEELPMWMRIAALLGLIVTAGRIFSELLWSKFYGKRKR